MAATEFRPLAVTGVGMVSAVGESAEQGCASIRAQVSRMSEHAAYAAITGDPGWEEEMPLVVAAVPGVDPLLPLAERLQALALGALVPLAGAARMRRADLPRTALLLALPWPDAAVAGAGVETGFPGALQRAAGLRGFRAVCVRSSGHTAVFELLAEASALLAAGEVDACLLVAVDSYLSEDRLRPLDEAYRVKSERNVDGFVPGEAAVALLLEPLDAARRRGADVVAVISGVALGSEPRGILSDRQSTGAGLTSALREVLAEASEPAWVLCDLNGESYRAFEWGLAVTRLPQQLGTVAGLTHPADCLGDVGAATGGVLLAVVAAAFRRGYAPARRVFLWTANEGSVRAAARVEAP